jgi:hypothetical protein
MAPSQLEALPELSHRLESSLHASAVQALPSEQVFAGPLHCPWLQRSPPPGPVQKSPSSHAVPSGR